MRVIVLCFLCVFYVGCYTPIGHYALLKSSSNFQEDSTKNDFTHNFGTSKGEIKNAEQQEMPFIFYRGCSKNGSAWLYECQHVALMSIKQALLLYQKDNHALKDVTMIFYPKKSYIRFELERSNISEAKE